MDMMTMDSRFLETLSHSPHAFAHPDLPLQTDILRYVKDLIDPVAREISTTQQQRQADSRRKRKRGELLNEVDPLRLRQIHIDKLGIEEVWMQTKRIIDATRREAQRSLELMRSTHPIRVTPSEEDDGSSEHSEDRARESSSHEEDLDSDGDITKEAFNEDDDIDLNSDESSEVGNVRGRTTEVFVQDKFGLNDGFFSIDDFNKQSEFLEQQDARGEDDDALSDEEEVDWDTDPLHTVSVPERTPGSLRQTNQTGRDDEEENSDDDGPTFGDPNAPSEDDVDDNEVDGGEMDGMGGLGNTNDILYKDFFAPPAQKKKKSRKTKPSKARQANSTNDAPEDDMQRTMDAVHRDLFDDDDGEEPDDVGTAQLHPADPRSRKSAHERRQAALAEEIRKLENANVAKREWTMSGEARAADRPVNSLLEEDLDFERTGKPVPVITAEVSESIEELIKRRIIAHDFQDIVRRRPDALVAGKDNRRGRIDFALDDTKSKKGLAEEYEEEHLRKIDPSFVDASDQKLVKEQREIELLWKDVSAKLDGLSSWHFRPKHPQAQLDIRVDAPTITMEDARPNAGGEISGASQLAPQELYKGGESSRGINDEVFGKSGLPTGREELTRDEKKRRRRRQKERIRKHSAGEPTKQESKASQDKQQLVGDLKRGNVKVIGKIGEVTDVVGNAVSTGASQTAASFKL